MIFLCYQLLIGLMLPVALLRLLIRSFKNKAYRFRIQERFGCVPFQLEGAIVVHAVSMGEVVASRSLVDRLRGQFPDCPIVVTTMTPSGSQQVLKFWPSQEVKHCYLPYDSVVLLNNFFKALRPKLFVLVETELWPGLMTLLKRKKIPVLLVNGRMSERSMHRYLKIKRLTKQMLSSFNVLMVQNQKHRRRFIELGAQDSQVVVTGSVKFDLTLDPKMQQLGKTFKAMWPNRQALILASSHAHEEDMLLQLMGYLKCKLPELLVIWVPRHPERFGAVDRLCQKAGFNVVRRSLGQPLKNNTDVFLGDTLGELMGFYLASDVAFVGGSFAPSGGHNVIEPIACGLPTVIGPSCFNFEVICQTFLNAGGLIQVKDVEDLKESLLILLQDDSLAQQLNDAATGILNDNRGALDKMVDVITPFL